MGRVSKKVEKSRSRCVKRRGCVYVTGRIYRTSQYVLEKEQKYGHFEVTFLDQARAVNLVALAPIIKRVADKSDQLTCVFAPTHGSKDGGVWLNGKKGVDLWTTLFSPRVPVSAVMIVILPMLPHLARLHFHTCSTGTSFEQVVSELNNCQELFRTSLGIEPKRWRVSGYTQDVYRYWEHEGTYSPLRLDGRLDTFVMNGLREGDAPPGVVRVITLEWSGEQFTITQSKMLGGSTRIKRTLRVIKSWTGAITKK